MERQHGVMKLLNNLTGQVFGHTLSGALESNICVDCGELAVVFRDEASKAEYEITGFCQKCQDEVFGV